MGERLTEEACLDKLGITTSCCGSCYSDSYYGYVELPEAEAWGFVVTCCCKHVDSIQVALRAGLLP